MAATPTPAYPQTPVSTMLAVSATANTGRSQIAGTPTNGILISPNTNTNGVRVDEIDVQGTGTTLAGQIIIWLYDGTNSNPIDEISVTVVTPSTTSAAFQATKVYTNKVLGPSCKLYATSTVASQLVSVGMMGAAL